MSAEVTVRRTEPEDPNAARLKAQVEAEFAAALEKRATLHPEVAITPPGPVTFEWNVWARGPYQLPGTQPGRIIALGQTAYIATVVWMNTDMCKNLAAFRADILLNYWTSNTQEMKPVPALNYAWCLEPENATQTPDGCYIVDVWAFTPTEEACLLETNICARLCNCDQLVAPGYAAFVRWVENFDPEVLFPATPTPGLEFDNPIRYMVYDPNAKCPCP